MTILQLPPRLQQAVDAARNAPPSADGAIAALGCLDLTSLNDVDTDASIAAFCQKAQVGGAGNVAALCVFPRFVPLAANILTQPHFSADIKLATVVNFETGQLSRGLQGEPVSAYDGGTDHVVTQCIQRGADEIDIVFDYQSFLAGDNARAVEPLVECYEAAGPWGKTVKVILETPQLGGVVNIERACELAAPYAHFLKTGTGRGGAVTLEQAAVVIDQAEQLGRQVKISSGVNFGNAFAFMELYRLLSGREPSPETFRFGASGVYDDLVRCAFGNDSVVSLRVPKSGGGRPTTEY